jgi:hypothetical protein
MKFVESSTWIVSNVVARDSIRPITDSKFRRVKIDLVKDFDE